MIYCMPPQRGLKRRGSVGGPEVGISETTAKSLLRKQKRIDSWFISSMGMNIYRGCTHGCAYCDGRAEQYRLEGVFGEDVAVKTNAAALLEREVDPKRRRKPLPGGFVLIGGGVTDAWQPIDRKYNLTEAVLKILLRAHLPVHGLTKSADVVRHLDLLTAINQERRAIVSFSFSSVNEEISAVVEPGLPGPKKRLEAMARIKAAEISAGMFLMPVIPGLTDTDVEIRRSLEAAVQAGADYVIFGGMTLKPGRQFDHFLGLVHEKWPELDPGYRKIYPGNRWGSALTGYYDKIHRRLAPIAQEMGVPLRIPESLWGDLVSDTERRMILSEHRKYLRRLGLSFDFDARD